MSSRKSRRVADIDGITFAALDILGDVLAADSGGDRALHIAHGQSIARRFRPIYFYVDVESLRDALGKDRPHLRHRPENLLNSARQVLDTFQVRPLNLDSHRRLDSCKLHVETILDRHGPRVCQARELEFGVHLRDQLFVSHSRAPLLAGFEHDCSVIHVQAARCRSRCRSGRRHRTRFPLREGAKDPVLLLQQLRRLSDRDAGKRGGHVQGDAFK